MSLTDCNGYCTGSHSNHSPTTLNLDGLFCFIACVMCGSRGKGQVVVTGLDGGLRLIRRDHRLIKIKSIRRHIYGGYKISI